MRSIKTRLLVLVLGGMTLVWIGAATFTYFDAREEVDELLDAHLAQAASLLVAQVSHEVEEIETEHLPTYKHSHRVAFQVWENGRVLRVRSANAPDEPLGPPGAGLSERALGGERWRVYSTWDESGKFLIQVGEQTRARDQLVREIAVHLLRPLLYSLPVLALLLWLAIASGLKPLRRLAGDIGRREPANLAPLDSTRSPAEVRPLIEQLNRLFERIARSIENERQFTADAAHELRTPVAAIKAQAQVARSATTDAEKSQAIEKVIRGSDHAAHLIDQLLTLARLDRAEPGTMQIIGLRTVAAAVLAELAPLAYEAGVSIELVDGEEVEVRGVPGLLHVLLRNLVDNAIRYSAAGTRVQVAASNADGPEIAVMDEGPGIPPNERTEVLKRFHRRLGTGQRGTGLGLSIVQRIVELHGADVSFESTHDDRGLRVVVRFKPVEPASVRTNGNAQRVTG